MSFRTRRTAKKTMKTDDGIRRLRRVKVWILLLSLLPAGILYFRGYERYSAGLVFGGAIVLLNLLGTERVVQGFIAGGGSGRVLVSVLGLFKLGLTGAAIAVIFHWNLASPLGLILGLSCLPMALLFDIFVFPVNKGAGKEI